MLQPLIDRLARPRNFALLLVTYAIVFGTILYTLGQLETVSGGNGILDFDRGYSAERVNEVLGSYGTGGMALYHRIQLLDLLNPALYALILSVLTYWLWHGRGWPRLPQIALLGGAGDYAENVTLFLMARAYPDIPTALVQTSSALSLIKNGLLLVSLIPLVVGLLLWMRDRRRR